MVDYNFKKDIALIRHCLGLNQTEFSQKVKLSRNNILNFENGSLSPGSDALEKIYNYSFSSGFDLNQSKTMIFEDKKGDSIVLYHGAKKTIEGDVDNKHSIPPNDFGDGFYLGESLKQANMWISAYEKSSTYCFYFKEYEDLKRLDFDVDFNWMVTILYFRGELEGYKLPREIEELIKKVNECDYIYAPIADNQMYDTIEAFRNNRISDIACVHALSANNLGYQYVMKSMKACKLLQPIERLYLCSAERLHYLNLKIESSTIGRNKTTLAYAQYRKEGKLFDEIFKKER